jgi:hypothetical protein
VPAAGLKASAFDSKFASAGARVMVRTILIFALLMAIPTATFAQDPRRGGTGEQQQACTKDVSRYCRKVMESDDAAILNCLKQNRSRISKTCLRSLDGDRG